MNSVHSQIVVLVAVLFLILLLVGIFLWTIFQTPEVAKSKELSDSCENEEIIPLQGKENQTNIYFDSKKIEGTQAQEKVYLGPDSFLTLLRWEDPRENERKLNYLLANKGLYKEVRKGIAQITTADDFYLAKFKAHYQDGLLKIKIINTSRKTIRIGQKVEILLVLASDNNNGALVDPDIPYCRYNYWDRNDTQRLENVNYKPPINNPDQRQNICR